MRYSLVLWDFDGTLADTLPGILRIFNELALEHGFVPITDVNRVRDTSASDLLRLHQIPMWKLPLLRRQVAARQKDQMADVRLHPGLPAMLERIHNAGGRMGILSSNNEQNIRTCLKANGAEQWFEFVVGYPRLLGKQRGLRRILRRTSLPAAGVLYVGDEVRDIAAARDAGMDVAAVTWGVNSGSLLAAHSPTRLIDRPEMLIDWLEL